MLNYAEKRFDRSFQRRRDDLARLARTLALPWIRNLQTSVLQTTDYGLRTTDYGLRTTAYGLRTPDSGLQTPATRL